MTTPETLATAASGLVTDVTYHLEEALKLARKWQDENEGSSDEELEKLQQLLIETLAEVGMAVHLRKTII